MLKNINKLKYLPSLIRKDRILEATFFITDVCNMKCRHCFVLEALNKKLKVLTPQEIRKMGVFVSPVQRVHVGGGEPFTRKDIFEVVRAFSESWDPGVICMPNNGWFTNRILNFIEQYGKTCKSDLRLHFSINSLDPSEMDNFTKLKGSFKRWKESITQAIELSQKYPHITIVALSTYNEHNQHCFKDLIDYLHKEIKVPDFSFQIARSHGSYKADVDYDHYREMIEYYFTNYNKQDKFIAAFRKLVREKSVDYFEDPKFSQTCTSGKIRVVISPTGDVYPCEKLGYPNLHEMAPWRLGNIRDYNYDINKLVKQKEATSCYEKICNSNCHCDHNIDRSLNLLAKKEHRRQLLKEVLS